MSGREGLQAAYDAFAKKDIGALLETLDESVVWNASDAYSYGGTYHGREGTAAFFGKIAEHWPEISVEPLEFLESGDTIAVRLHVRGTAKNGSVDMDAMHLCRMRDGKIAEFNEYVDTARMLHALGETLAVATT